MSKQDTQKKTSHGRGGLLWAVLFVCTLPIALIAQLTGWRWQPWVHSRDNNRPFYEEADSVAQIIVGMTHSIR